MATTPPVAATNPVPLIGPIAIKTVKEKRTSQKKIKGKTIAHIAKTLGKSATLEVPKIGKLICRQLGYSRLTHRLTMRACILEDADCAIDPMIFFSILLEHLGHEADTLASAASSANMLTTGASAFVQSTGANCAVFSSWPITTHELAYMMTCLLPSFAN